MHAEGVLFDVMVSFESNMGVYIPERSSALVPIQENIIHAI